MTQVQSKAETPELGRIHSLEREFLSLQAEIRTQGGVSDEDTKRMTSISKKLKLLRSLFDATEGNLNNRSGKSGRSSQSAEMPAGQTDSDMLFPPAREAMQKQAHGVAIRTLAQAALKPSNLVPASTPSHAQQGTAMYYEANEPAELHIQIRASRSETE